MPSIDISSVFSTDFPPLTYRASNADVTFSGATMTVTPSGLTTETVTVTATDSRGQEASTDFLYNTRGIRATVPADTLRDDHYAEVGGKMVRTTLLEPAATNWVASSSDLSALPGVAVTSGVDTIHETAVTSRHYVYLEPAVAVGDATYAVDVAADGRDYATVAIGQTATGDYYAVTVNLTTGAVTQVSDVGADVRTHSVAATDDGWWRVTIRGPKERYFIVGPSNAATFTPSDFGFHGYAGTVSVGIKARRLFASEGAAASYIPTYGAVATRAADALSKTLAAGDVRLRWYDAAGAAQSAIVAHGGGTFTAPVTGGRAYYEIDLDTGGGYASAYRPGDATWTHTRASAADFTARNPAALPALPASVLLSDDYRKVYGGGGITKGGGTLGSTTAADTGDPAPTKDGLLLAVGDYVKYAKPAGTPTYLALRLSMPAAKCILFTDDPATAHWVPALENGLAAGYSYASGTPSVYVNGTAVSPATRDGLWDALAAATAGGAQATVEVVGADLSGWAAVRVSSYAGHDIQATARGFVCAASPTTQDRTDIRAWLAALDPPSTVGSIADQYHPYE